MLRSSLMLGLLLQAMPRRLLQQRLAAHGPSGPGVRCTPFFSGRTALAALAALPQFTRKVALVPAYLCNVVPMALQRHGWRVVGYDVDERFEPDHLQLARQAERENAGLLLLAPLYGADGGCRWWCDAPGRALRQRLGLALVLDLCQDAGALARIGDCGSRWAAVASFNDKSFPGVMGAALWTDLPVPEPAVPGWRDALLLQAWALRKLLPRRAAHREEGFEHSRAERFPYGFEPAGASRLQMALGAVGLRRLPRWQARRRAAVHRGDVRPLDLPGAQTSPFVVCAEGDPGLHRGKRPYALADDPQRSARPRLLIRHNKGFDDR